MILPGLRGSNPIERCLKSFERFVCRFEVETGTGRRVFEKSFRRVCASFLFFVGLASRRSPAARLRASRVRACLRLLRQ